MLCNILFYDWYFFEYFYTVLSCCDYLHLSQESLSALSKSAEQLQCHVYCYSFVPHVHIIS